MKTITATKARSNLYKLIDETATVNEPIQIMGKRTNAVLISEEDWSSIQETLFLVSIPGMRESIIKGMKEPLNKSSNKLKW
jgi:PHD/YefM family antitoxin component YafN of YafNO toxin-antitoxin module